MMIFVLQAIGRSTRIWKNRVKLSQLDQTKYKTRVHSFVLAMQLR